MVLEALINPLKAEAKPWETFFIGMIYASAAVIVSLLIFVQYSSIVMIAFTVMASIPLIYGAIRTEEKKDTNAQDKRLLIKEHGKALSVFVFMFLGFTAAFILWYILLPQSLTEIVFSAQTQTIAHINNPLAGNFFNSTSAFGLIFMNNFKVLLFCLIFAFFYGFGAIFILTWNASVLAAVIGNLIKASSSSLIITPLIMLRYLLHGIPEILAYFTAGLAGGIISIAVIRHDFSSKKFKTILADSLDLITLSVIILIAAALIEVFISPAIF